MNIAIVCYASVGGSGIVATELAKSLARRSHQVHLISTEPPFRLAITRSARVPSRADAQLSALSRASVPVVARHANRAALARVPVRHRSCALRDPHGPRRTWPSRFWRPRRAGDEGAQVITTLHGTDITLLGSDPSYSETVAFSIEQSDGVTAVSESLKRDTYQSLPLKRDIRVIPNFLECDVHCRRDLPDLRARLCPPEKYDKLIVHLSNFRPVKRVDMVVDILSASESRFAPSSSSLEKARSCIRQCARCTSAVSHARGGARRAGPGCAAPVGVGPVRAAVGPGKFRPAALERWRARCRSWRRGGGLPRSSRTRLGFLLEPQDTEGMAKAALSLLTDAALHERFAKAGLERVRRHFCATRVVPQYEAYYQEVFSTDRGFYESEARMSRRHGDGAPSRGATLGADAVRPSTRRRAVRLMLA